MGQGVQPGQKIAVWFSCGAASAVAAKITLDMYQDTNEIHILNNPILEEGEDNQRFLRDVSEWLGHPIEHVTSKTFPNQSVKEVWEKRKYMSGIAGAPCTYELKKKPRQEWEEIHKPDWTVLGFTSEEKKRAERFKLTERESLLTPLINCGFDKQACFDVIHSQINFRILVHPRYEVALTCRYTNDSVGIEVHSPLNCPHLGYVG